MDLKSISIEELVKKIKSGEYTCEEVTNYYLESIEKYNYKNAVLEVFEDALDEARKIDQRLKNREDVGALAGVPIIIKDNMQYKGHKCTCASKFMQDYVSQFTATAVQKLLDEGVVILGRANMDEFAMGASCEHSAFGLCKNALDDTRVAGGSSGGSAVAVACDMCCFALGSDTGGSIRQPASFNGVVGLKPTYGRVSRFGLVAFASSLDQIGPICKSVEDAMYVLKYISGVDENDQTTFDTAIPDIKEASVKSLEGLKLGIIKQAHEVAKKSKYYEKYAKLIEKVQKSGAKIEIVDLPEFDLSLPAYYVIAPAEAASNLGRFDGIKYSRRAEGTKVIGEVYKKSRTEGFGEEVKRRIMLGNFALSSGYYDAYYKNAKRVQKLLLLKFENAFKGIDAIILPTSLGEAFKIGSHSDPVSMYAEDLFTIFVNLAELPAVSVPFDKTSEGMPLGVQVVAKRFDEANMLQIARLLQEVR